MSIKKASKNTNGKLDELLRIQQCLQREGANTRHEIQQLKISLRITQQRARRINAQIKRELEERPTLTLVYSAP